MSEFLVGALIIGALIWVFTSIVNGFERFSNGEPLGTVREKEKCKLHTWRDATFLNFNEFEAYKTNPEKFLNRKTKYCSTCGYVPTLEKMVLPKFLEQLKAQEKLAEEARLRVKDVNELKKEYLDIYLKACMVDHTTQMLISEGYMLYDKFVEELPELIKRRDLARILDKLKEPESPAS